MPLTVIYLLQKSRISKIKTYAIVIKAKKRTWKGGCSWHFTFKFRPLGPWSAYTSYRSINQFGKN